MKTMTVVYNNTEGTLFHIPGNIPVKIFNHLERRMPEQQVEQIMAQHGYQKARGPIYGPETNPATYTVVYTKED